MIKHHFSCPKDFALAFTLNNIEIKPDHDNGFLGRLKPGDELKLTLIVLQTSHRCFKLNPEDLTQQIDVIPTGCGVYEQNMVVNKLGLFNRWPLDNFSLNTNGKEYSIGVYIQHDSFFLGIEEFIEDPKDKIWQIGEVMVFSLLRGNGRVQGPNQVVNRIHFSRVGGKPNGVRYLETGEIIYPTKIKKISSGKTSFQEEIIRYTK